MENKIKVKISKQKCIPMVMWSYWKWASNLVLSYVLGEVKKEIWSILKLGGNNHLNAALALKVLES